MLIKVKETCALFTHSYISVSPQELVSDYKAATVVLHSVFKGKTNVQKCVHMNAQHHHVHHREGIL